MTLKTGRNFSRRNFDAVKYTIKCTLIVSRQRQTIMEISTRLAIFKSIQPIQTWTRTGIPLRWYTKDRTRDQPFISIMHPFDWFYFHGREHNKTLWHGQNEVKEHRSIIVCLKTFWFPLLNIQFFPKKI